MSVPAAALRLMLEMGLSAEQMVSLAEAFSADQKPRSEGAERTRRWRERNAEASHVTSRETSQRDVTGDGHRDVTAPPALDKEIPPTPPKEINLTPASCAAPSAEADVREVDPVEDDWPEADGDGKRAIATWATRLTQLAGPGLADPAKTPSLLTSSVEIGRWRKAGCSWETDVVPVIQARTAQLRNQPINAWTYFTAAVLAQASNRKSSLVIPLHPEGVPDVRKSARSGSDRQARYAERLSPIAAAMAAAVEQPSG